LWNGNVQKQLAMPKSNYYRWIAAIKKAVNKLYRHGIERRNNPEVIAKYRISERNKNVFQPNNHFKKQRALNRGIIDIDLPF